MMTHQCGLLNFFLISPEAGCQNWLPPLALISSTFELESDIPELHRGDIVALWLHRSNSHNSHYVKLEYSKVLM